MIFRQELHYYTDNISYYQRWRIKQEMVRDINTQLDTKIGNFFKAPSINTRKISYSTLVYVSESGSFKCG